MSEKQSCQGLWGKLFGHNFQSQYDTEVIPSPNGKAELYKRPDLREIIADVCSEGYFEDVAENVLSVLEDKSSDHRRHTYRGTVCTRCGLVVSYRGVLD